MKNSADRPYRSPDEAYPFLCDAAADLRCDFELATDELASETGLLAAKVAAADRRDELLWVAELIYHANPTLRTRLSLTPDEIGALRRRTAALMAAAGEDARHFLLPQGCETACLAHLLRVRAKALVRLVYRYAEGGGPVDDALLDFCNLLSGYFFGIALAENRAAGVPEREFVSRNYPHSR